jgi:D-serine deaminase-like pyridoxal phosphate-dependent protein
MSAAARRPDLLVTSRRLRDLGLRRASLLVDRPRAEANLARFAARAAAAGAVLRPHFKTHQSGAVAGWFRAAGVRCATVSSVGMAAYFADHGWDDLTLAIGANPLECADYDDLAERVRLGLLVDAPAALERLAAGLRRQVALWLEVDTGAGRCGVAWDDRAGLVALARRIGAAAPHRFAGLLTHAGDSYAAADPAAAAAVFARTRERLQAARDALTGAGLPAPLLSAGDTPGFAASEDWSGLDEARPGNFVFHDLMQLACGACGEADLACAVACPVIGVYPRRAEAVVHAGAAHLSCESLPLDGRRIFGRLLGLGPRGFAGLLPGWEMAGLSQEHGRLAARTQTARDQLARLAPGDLVLVVPVHACLACEQFGSYRTLAGEVLPRWRRDEAAPHGPSP